MGMRIRLVVPIAVAVFAAGCNDGASGDVTSQPTVPTARDYHDVASVYCAGKDGAVELAFDGTVASVEESDGLPWVTFDVDAWWTDDLGGQVSLWAPGVDLQAGERWIIRSSRYAVGPSFSVGGDVFPCVSMPSTAPARAELDAEYGGTVDPGQQTPEQPPDPAVLAAIDDAEARWGRAQPVAWTADIAAYTDDFEGFTGTCGSGEVRVVVEDGMVVQARDLQGHCDVPLDEAPRPAALYNLLRDSAGAVESYDFDTETGLPLEWYAQDRAVSTSVGVRHFRPRSLLLADIDDRAGELANAKKRWADAQIGDYTMRVSPLCFCSSEPVVFKVADGRPVGGSDEWFGSSVTDLFALLESNLDADLVLVAYDKETGAPVEIRLDPELNTSDDELELFVSDFSIGDGTPAS